MKEVWRDVKNYEGYYKISNLGNIKSLYIKRNLKLKPTPHGYFRVGLKINKKRKMFFIHRIVAENFIENFNNKPFINHIDGNKLNNRIENLEWCTRRENINHAVKHNLFEHGEKRKNHKLTVLKVKEIRKIYEQGGITQEKLAQIFNVGHSTIGYVINYIAWKNI